MVVAYKQELCYVEGILGIWYHERYILLHHLNPGGLFASQRAYSRCQGSSKVETQQSSWTFERITQK